MAIMARYQDGSGCSRSLREQTFTDTLPEAIRPKENRERKDQRAEREFLGLGDSVQIPRIPITRECSPLVPLLRLRESAKRARQGGKRNLRGVLLRQDLPIPAMAEAVQQNIRRRKAQIPSQRVAL